MRERPAPPVPGLRDGGNPSGQRQTTLPVAGRTSSLQLQAPAVLQCSEPPVGCPHVTGRRDARRARDAARRQTRVRRSRSSRLDICHPSGGPDVFDLARRRSPLPPSSIPRSLATPACRPAQRRTRHRHPAAAPHHGRPPPPPRPDAGARPDAQRASRAHRPRRPR